MYTNEKRKEEVCGPLSLTRFRIIQFNYFRIELVLRHLVGVDGEREADAVKPSQDSRLVEKNEHYNRK